MSQQAIMPTRTILVNSTNLPSPALGRGQVHQGDLVIAQDTGQVYIVVGDGTTVARSLVPLTGGSGGKPAIRFWAGALQTAHTVVLPVTVNAFFADDQPSTVQTNTTAIGYPVPFACTCSLFRVNVTANASLTNATATVYQNGAPTGQTVTILAGVTGVVSDLVDTTAFAAGDQIDFFITNTGGGGGLIELAASVQLG